MSKDELPGGDLVVEPKIELVDSLGRATAALVANRVTSISQSAWEKMPEPKGNWVTRAKQVWAVAYMVIEDLIVLADGFMAARPGEERKAFVVGAAMDVIQWLEDRYDVLPPVIEGIVLRVIRMVIGTLVQRVFDRLRAAGQV